ncbi:MAG: preprotein translocase subunit SecG [Phycisphaerae bacterium]|jgi:preprotein translocase subunit SecG
MGLLLCEVSFVMHVVSVLWLLSALLLILVVLIQKGKGGGLSGAFGGGMASGILGTKTGDFLTWVTIGLAGAFILLTVVMAKFYRPSLYGPVGEPPMQSQPLEQPQVPQGLPESDATTMPQPGPVDLGAMGENEEMPMPPAEPNQ